MAARLEGFGYRPVANADLNQVAVDVRRGVLFHAVKRVAGLEDTDGGVRPEFGGVDAVEIFEPVIALIREYFSLMVHLTSCANCGVAHEQPWEWEAS